MDTNARTEDFENVKPQNPLVIFTGKKPIFVRTDGRLGQTLRLRDATVVLQTTEDEQH
jgi:hypothetical protein